MAEISKKHKNRLKEIKKNIEDSRQYFQKNIDRYHEFMKFTFKSSLNEADIATLQELGKPTIEFNILEAMVSRLRGEFAKQQPSLSVRAADGVPLQYLTDAFLKQIEVIEMHLRAIFFDASNDKLEYNVYTDCLAGGFSVMQVYTDYLNEMSFDQEIKVDRVFDPTLCGFDPLARDSHKGDGQYCFELYPLTKEEFSEKFGSKAASKMKYSRSIGGFSWSYRNETKEVVLVCDYYEKKRRKEKIIKLSNGNTVTVKEYEEFLEAWAESGNIEQPAQPVGQPRTTHIEYIVRYRLCENEVLDYTETNYRHLPLVFVDGNSVYIEENDTSYQMTRPYVYHAKGIQQLKNFAGQSMANELENLVQHKFVVPLEAIPEDYLEAYQDVQKADTLIYKHFYDKADTTVTLPGPREITRTPIPPQISETFRMSDEMTQVILGTYDNATGANNNRLSGIAMTRGAMNSNNASVPYIVGYIKGLNRVAQIVVDLIPKYYVTPRSLPVLKPNGQRSYEMVNAPNSIYMNYDPLNLQVKVETGVNFAIQKEMALQTILSLMQASPTFAEFINSEGLEVLLDNIEIRGIDQLKAQAEKWQKQNDMQKQQMQQMQMQQAQQQEQMQTQAQQMELAKAQRELQSPTKTQLDMMKMQQEAQQEQADNRFKAADLALKEQKIEDDFVKILSDVQNTQVDNELERERIAAEQARTAVDMAKTIAQAEKLGEE